MVLCILLQRFELVVALGGRAALAREPVALAPESGRAQNVGEPSASAQARGVIRGMRLGEAIARCPALKLIPPDPVGVADSWEKTLANLEAIGARVEDGGPGVAFIEANELRRLHGGPISSRTRALQVGGAWWLDGVVGAVRAAVGMPVRIGAGPSRFCAFAGASRARSRKAELVDGEKALATASVTLLRQREEVADVADPLLRMGIETLGDVAKMPRSKLADRFGRAGERVHDLARGRDTPLRPRIAGELISESLQLPESASGQQLERALGLLIDRLLARRERRGMTIRAVVIAARLVEGGTWRERVVFRESLSDGKRIRLALSSRLSSLPAPAEALRLSVSRMGAPLGGADALFGDGDVLRRERLREGIEQARAAAGPDAAMRVVEIDPDSRVPERRALLTPHEL
jgi:protein ImuB